MSSLKQSPHSNFVDSQFRAPSVSRPRSTFNRSHNVSTTIYDDVIVPVFCQAIIPGDTVNVKMTQFLRMNPTIAPLMDNVWMDVHAFFVPNRLTWDHWENFMGQKDNLSDTTDYLIPQVNTPQAPYSTGWSRFSLGDYFGLPVENAAIPSVSALPFRGYGLIWNEWYRPENIISAFNVPTGDGPDVPSTTYVSNPLLRMQRHDYFTAGLPWPQKGPSIPIPSSPYVGVESNGQIPWLSGSAGGFTDLPIAALNAGGDIVVSGSVPSNTAVKFGSQTGLRANLSENTTATIYALTQAFALQRLSERDARGGTRYTEIILSHFGVRSSDARLQRPEFLGGGSSLLQMNPVAQTSEPSDSPQGNLAANGVLIGNTSISKSFEEHGYMFILVSIRGDQTYSQGIDREWSRLTKNDFFWPDLAHIGEQAVLKKELFANGVSNNDNAVFSYMPRYDEMRYQKSYNTGLMRPDITGNVAYWNLQREYDSSVALNAAFIQSQTPFERVLQVPSQPTFLCNFHFDFKHSRVMPTYSVPGQGRYL